jgi:DNA-binding beta-propeller fold protein YncE
MKRFFPGIRTLIAAGMLVLCGAWFQSSVGAPEQSSSPWVWPLPPEQPRIQQVLAFRTPQDMGAKKGFFAKLWEFIAGEDTADRIESPHGVVADGKGKVYVADWGAGIIHLFDLDKKKYDSFSKTKLGPLASPIGVAVDEAGLLYVTDSALRRVFVFKGTKNVAMIGDDALERPTGIAVNAKERRLYVVDTTGHRVVVFSLEGQKLFSFGERGSGDGQLNYPTHIALDAAGDAYVMDALNFRVQIFDGKGVYVAQFGGNGTSIKDFMKPKGIAVSSDGHIWVSDGLRNSIQVFDRKGRLLLIFGRLGTEKGEFNIPAGIFIDGRDRLFVSDSYNHRVQKFQYLR